MICPGFPSATLRGSFPLWQKWLLDKVGVNLVLILHHQTTKLVQNTILEGLYLSDIDIQYQSNISQNTFIGLCQMSIKL